MSFKKKINNYLRTIIVFIMIIVALILVSIFDDYIRGYTLQFYAVFNLLLGLLKLTFDRDEERSKSNSAEKK